MSLNKQRLVQQLMRHEGLRLKPYLDTEGIMTIGVGRNLEGKGISESEAMVMLNNDVNDAVISARAVVGSAFVKLNGPRKAVVINMVFNLGRNGLRGFKRMLAALRLHDYQTAADEMLDSKWAVQVGNRAVELAQQMRTGKYE